MKSKRQIKYSRQLQKDLSEIFRKDPRYFFGDSLGTITNVSVSSDLGFAKIYVSIFPLRMTKSVFKNLERVKSEIRNKLGRKIGSRSRMVPELAFFHDDTEERASHLDQLIDELEIPPMEPNEE